MLRIVVAAAVAALLAGGIAYAAPLGKPAWRQSGIASWYGPGFEGRLTAGGCRFHAAELSAASRTLPIGAWVRVRRPSNSRVVIVPITDRGPYVVGRIIDLSRAAAEALDMVAAGIVLVELEPIGHNLGPCPNG